MDLDVSHFELTRNVTNTENEKVNASPAKEEYKKELAQTLMQTGAPSNKVRSPGSFVPLTNTMYTTSKDGHAQPFSSFPRHGRILSTALLAWPRQVLSFKTKAPQARLDQQCSLRVLYSQNREAEMQPRKYSRHIPQAPERILDAPELLDDYYLNLLDWSSTNVLGVALGDSIYLWNANDGSIQQLMQTQGEQSHVTSLSWIGQVQAAPCHRTRQRSASDRLPVPSALLCQCAG